MDQGQVVRFVKPSRHNDWQKGQIGSIVKVLATKPDNLNDLFVVRVKGYDVWATGEDIEQWNQLSLF